MQDSDSIKRRNDAIIAGRLFGGSVKDKETERCHQCGELLHPYPEPEFWMQYPLPTCCVVDGVKVCDDSEKPECLDSYLASNPTPAEAIGSANRPRRAKKAKAEEPGRDARAAVIATSLPDDRDKLLEVAAAAVAGLHEAVLNGADLVVEVADDRYNAAVWKLNGGTFFGCQGDENAAGRIIERYCQAAPGEIPMWGQVGEFLLEVEGVRAVVEVTDGFGSLANRHFAFHAVDLDGPFISETGYRSHFDRARARMTVDQVAGAIFAQLLRTHRRYLEPASQGRLASMPVRPWLAGLAVPPRHVPAVAEDWRQPTELPPGFVWVDAVLPAQQAFIARKWALNARNKIANAQKKVAATTREAVSAAPTARGRPKSDDDDAPPRLSAFCPGQRCEIINVHHPCFAKEVGKHVIITKISAHARVVWAHDDKPPRYRINRNGRKVCEYDPRCIESCYGYDQLRAIT
ncbi:klcB [Salmonella enterica subsp. enterica serovar Enteritidis]|nr:klcB [Salmonella enterica subsp. enterica serovar Enteritidis]